MPEPTKNLRITLKLEGLPEEDGHVRLSDLLTELQALKDSLDNVDRMVGQTNDTVLYYRVIDLKHSSPATDEFHTFDDGGKGGISLLALTGNVAGDPTKICHPLIPGTKNLFSSP
jgi:hypothetical protein